MSTHGYGWKPDLPDQRDQTYAAVLPTTAVPPSVDLRAKCPPVYDQGQLGSCTANAIAAAMQYGEGLKSVMPSRLFVYYNERAMEGTVGSDAGAAIRDGVKSVNRLGVCPESEWPYAIDQFATKPPATCYTDAVQHKALSYSRVMRTPGQFKGVLASGFPFAFGFSVYESFESDAVAKSGHAPMPAHGEQLLGGHAVMCVGYDDASRTWLCRNSWGTGWGMAGYFTLPYPYLASAGLSSDFWCIRQAS